MALRNDGGQIDRRYNIVQICQDMGWTYQEYRSQPVWFLQLLNDKLEAEDQSRKIDNEELKTKQNGNSSNPHYRN